MQAHAILIEYRPSLCRGVTPLTVFLLFLGLQENGSDCGAFAVAFASYLADDLLFDFGQKDITQMRRRMMWSLLHQRLV